MHIFFYCERNAIWWTLNWDRSDMMFYLCGLWCSRHHSDAMRVLMCEITGCLLNNLVGLTTNRISKIHITGPLWATAGFPLQRTSNTESVFKPWCRHVSKKTASGRPFLLWLISKTTFSQAEFIQYLVHSDSISPKLRTWSTFGFGLLWFCIGCITRYRYITGTGDDIRMSQCQWSNHENPG